MVCTCGSQRTLLRNWFTPLTFNMGSSHLISPCFCFETQPYYESLAVLELTQPHKDPPASASPVPALMACTTDVWFLRQGLICGSGWPTITDWNHSANFHILITIVKIHFIPEKQMEKDSTNITSSFKRKLFKLILNNHIQVDKKECNTRRLCTKQFHL